MEDTAKPYMRRRRSSSGTKSRERRPSNEKSVSPGMDRRNSSGGGMPMQRRRSSLGPVQEEQPMLDDDEELMSSSMDEYTSSEVAGTRQSRNTADDNDHHNESFSGPLHYLPLVVAVVPPLGAVLHGRAEAWTDALILLLVAFYLYQIVRVPWEIYYASRTRRINLAMTILGDGVSNDEVPEAVVRRRKAAQTELYQQELLSLAFCVLSPFIGSYLLYWVKGALSEPDRYINPFNIRLFVMGSGVKPIGHLIRLIKSRSIFLQSEVHYPVPTVTSLLKRVSRLENELDDLRKGYATKSDVKMLRDGVDAPLTQLSKALKRSERKEEYLRLSSEEKFALMSERQEEMLNEITVSAHLIEQLRMEQHRSGSVLRVMRHIFSGERPIERVGEATSYLWYERGPFFYLFLPIIASNRMLDATGRLFGSLHLRVASTETSGMIEGRSE